MSKEERIKQAYKVYEEQIALVDKQAAEAREFYKRSLRRVLADIRRQDTTPQTADTENNHERYC